MSGYGANAPNPTYSLIADPKEVRKQRAAQGKATKKGAGGQSG
jgi:hypothetical protein